MALKKNPQWRNKCRVEQIMIYHTYNNIIQENFSEITLNFNFSIKKEKQMSEKVDSEDSI